MKRDEGNVEDPIDQSVMARRRGGEGFAQEAARLRRTILIAQRQAAFVLAQRLRRSGLTPLQGEILMVLAEDGAMNLGELGKRLSCRVDSPSRAVDRLVERELVRRVRARTDRRVARLSLTSLGRRHALVSADAAGLVDDVLIERLNSAEREQLRAILEKLTQGVFDLKVDASALDAVTSIV